MSFSGDLQQSSSQGWILQQAAQPPCSAAERPEDGLARDASPSHLCVKRWDEFLLEEPMKVIFQNESKSTVLVCLNHSILTLLKPSSSMLDRSGFIAEPPVPPSCSHDCNCS